MNAAVSANVYDFDHTIYRGDASFHFIRYCLLHYPRLWRYLPAQGLVLVLYLLRLRDRKQVKEVAFSFLRSLPDVDGALRTFWQRYEKHVEPWYRKNYHPNDIIISASPEFLLAPIAEALGVKVLLATDMNKHTGKINGENCRGPEKLRRLQAYNAALLINEFYSDSLSDLPLLELAVKPSLVKKGLVTPYVKKPGLK